MRITRREISNFIPKPPTKGGGGFWGKNIIRKTNTKLYDMCLYPKLMINKKYTPTRKNNYQPPIMEDDRVKYVAIGCGKCIECMKQKGNNWRVRMLEELRVSKNCYFITLTIDNDNYLKLWEKMAELWGGIDQYGYKMQNMIAKQAVRYWLERIRRTTKKSIKHWLITELGQENEERIHLHGILFNIDNIKLVNDKWKYGITWVGEYVNEKTVNYIVKYLNKTDKKHMGYTPLILTSAGIGANYLKRKDWKNNIYKGDTGEETNETYRDNNGIKRALPIYYRNKIYTEEQKEFLWLEKLDKQERYVLGNKIDISEGDDNYEKALDYARMINKKLGYGSDEKTEDEEHYKKLKHEILWKTRQKLIEKGKLK